MLHLVMLCTL